MKTEHRYFLLGLLVALALVFLIAAGDDTPPRYQIAEDVHNEYRFYLLDTRTGKVIRVHRNSHEFRVAFSADKAREAFGQ